MQAPTHLATGILIQKAIRKRQRYQRRYSLTIASLALLSHGILDRLARFTYHPPVPLIQDWFWISYHLVIAVLTVYVVLNCWRKYKLGIIFSVLPDIDWVVLHVSDFLSIQIPFWKEPILHKFLFSFLDLLPPFSFLNSLSNWNLERKGALLEVALLATLIASIYLTERKDEEIHL